MRYPLRYLLSLWSVHPSMPRRLGYYITTSFCQILCGKCPRGSIMKRIDSTKTRRDPEELHHNDEHQHQEANFETPDPPKNPATTRMEHSSRDWSYLARQYMSFADNESRVFTESNQCGHSSLWPGRLDCQIWRSVQYLIGYETTPAHHPFGPSHHSFLRFATYMLEGQFEGRH